MWHFRRGPARRRDEDHHDHRPPASFDTCCSRRLRPAGDGHDRLAVGRGHAGPGGDSYPELRRGRELPRDTDADRTRARKLGARRFSIPAGATRAVAVALSTRRFQVVVRARRLSVQACAIYEQAPGVTVSAMRARSCADRTEHHAETPLETAREPGGVARECSKRWSRYSPGAACSRQSSPAAPVRIRRRQRRHGRRSGRQRDRALCRPTRRESLVARRQSTASFVRFCEHWLDRHRDARDRTGRGHPWTSRSRTPWCSAPTPRAR